MVQLSLTKQRLPQPIKWLVAVSLALNLFLLSALLVSHWQRQQALEADVDRSLAKLIANLPDADAQALRDASRAKRQQIKAARIEFDSAAQRATQIASREPFDASAFKAALENLRTQRQAILDIRIALYVEIAPKLSPQARRQLAQPN